MTESDVSRPGAAAPRAEGGVGSDTRLATASFAIAGACSYVVLVLTGRSLPADAFAVFAGFWSITFFIAGATQAPLEQELVRSQRAALSEGVPAAGTARTIVGGSAALVVAACVALVGGWIPLTRQLFDGSVAVLVASCAVLTGEAVTAMVRGMAAGVGDFRRFAGVVAAQGLVRATLIATLAVMGVGEVGWYAAAVAVGNVPGVVASRSLRRTVQLGRFKPAASSLRRHLTYLYLAAPFIALFTIGVPAVAKGLASEAEQADVGSLLAALSLTSAPIFLLTAVQSSILPHFTELASSGDRHGFIRVLRRLGGGIVGVGLFGTVAAAVVGNRLLSLLFGDDKQIERWQIAALAVTTAAMMMSIAVAPALLALRRHGAVALAWAAGAVVFAVTLGVSDDLLSRCVSAMTLGALIAGAMMTAAVVVSVRVAGVRSDPA